MSDEPLRQLLVRVLDCRDAHVTFDAAVENVASPFRGVRPAGLPYSAWELVEHMRITQRDILDFCRDPGYRERRWPDDYWPATAEPESDSVWEESIAANRADLKALKRLAEDSDLDLHAPIPHGTGQTYARELLLVADHTAYHVGQLVLVRRLLGVWPEP